MKILFDKKKKQKAEKSTHINYSYHSLFSDKRIVYSFSHAHQLHESIECTADFITIKIPMNVLTDKRITKRNETPYQ